MRFQLLLLCLLAAFTSSFSQSHVSWSISSERSGDHTYILTIQVNIGRGWHVYAEHDSINGLEPVQVTWENEAVVSSAPGAVAADNPVRLNDPIFGNKNLKVYEGSFTITQPIAIKGVVPASLKITIKGFAANKEEFIPFEEMREVALEGGVTTSQNLKLASVDLDKPVAGCGDEQKKNKSLLAIFLLGFAGGLIALLTPCVFPMIPVTVSFFTNRAKTKQEGIRNGILYGSIIFLIYLLASLPFHLLNNVTPEILNNISTNAWLNVFFFAIFIVFALSFFGLFEIALPSSVNNKAGSKGGIFFMALTLVTVSFSCTGVILGSLLVGSLSSNGGAWQLTAGMGGFGAALALPFGLFAMFPQWMKRLPKSGGWLQKVKISLAFVELALAFKFLSNADLVEHWGLLKREVFIGIWILIALGLALYLSGLFSNQRKIEGFSFLKLKEPGKSYRWVQPMLATLVFLFALYLIPGLTNSKWANLKLLSGFPPPLNYSIYGSNNIHNKGLEPTVVNDYEKALQLAKEQGKPVLIDFTGWACVNCRKMEEQVWTEPEIAQLINDKFILVSLYVDDRKKLPAGEQFTYKTNEGSKKDIKTLGDKWATFQAENFKQVTQPLYVVLSPDERLMNLPVGYTPKAVKYREWLECGIKAFQELGKNRGRLSKL